MSNTLAYFNYNRGSPPETLLLAIAMITAHAIMTVKEIPARKIEIFLDC
jgi:hypothetical protein